jgi:hypothetical protein
MNGPHYHFSNYGALNQVLKTRCTRTPSSSRDNPTSFNALGPRRGPETSGSGKSPAPQRAFIHRSASLVNALADRESQYARQLNRGRSLHLAALFELLHSVDLTRAG